MELLYALQNGKLVSINDVDSGLNCNCVCPACKKPLIAKKGNTRIHHFAHIGNGNCQYGYETSIHLLAKEIIAESTYIVIPSVIFGKYNPLIISENKKVDIKEVKCEQFIDNIKPDIIVDTDVGKIIIEIYVTHKVDNTKLEKISNIGIDTIEIDLSKYNELIDKTFLTKILLEDSPLKTWIFNNSVESLKKDLMFEKKMLHKCSKQRRNAPNYVYCISECEHFLDDFDDEKFFCTNALDMKKSTQNQEIVFCMECGCLMSLEYGKHGAFYTCPGCSHTERAPNSDMLCPICNSKLVLRKKGINKFYGCSKYPSCSYTKSYKKK